MMRETCVFAVSGERKQARGDLVVREALRDEPQHLDLALGETVERARVDGILHSGRRPFEKPAGDARARAAPRPRRRRAPRGCRSTGSVSFTRKPLAPARIARATYSSSSNVVTMTTLTDRERRVGGDLLGRPEAVAVRHPDVEQCHIDRRRARIARSSSSPPDASATTSMSGSESSSARNPARTSWWSSASATRITTAPARAGAR